ncbi:sulfite exporter TauE/SafE family protein [Bacteroidota bacterium]
MNNEIFVLILSAVSIGFIHTVLGPDHYLPFIALSKSESWSNTKTAIITILSGAGHVLSSIILGIIGVALGLAVFSLESIESVRGEIAGWLLIIFGLVYTMWGIRKAYKKKPHTHKHFHADGTIHHHDHTHENHEHAHVHKSKKKISPWMIFIIFVFGPCEPLIPLLIYPAANHSMFGMLMVALVFGITTIFTMLMMVFIGIFGINFIPVKKLELHIHTLAGATILMCGVSIQFLGL